MSTSSQGRLDDDLPYVVELWQEAPKDQVERILAKSSSLKLAHAILKSAEQEFPQRRVTLRNGAEIISETKPRHSLGS